MLISSFFDSDFAEQKQSAAKQGESAKQAFDTRLANFIQQVVEKHEIALCLVSGAVVLKKDARSALFIDWRSSGGTSGVAQIDNHGRPLTFFYEDCRKLNGLIQTTKRAFSQWIDAGGLHTASQWHGPISAHVIPPEIARLRSTNGRLQAYSHLYNRWIYVRQLIDNNKYAARDLRRMGVLEQLGQTGCSLLPPASNGVRDRLFKNMGLPLPFNWAYFTDVDGHRHVPRDDAFYEGYNFL